MDFKISKRCLIIYISFFLITMDESLFFIEMKINTILSCLGYFILLYNIYLNYIKKEYKNKNLLRFLFLIIFLFNIGIIIQPTLEVLSKIRLIFSTVILASIAIMPEGYIRNFKEIRAGAYGILSAILISILLAVMGGISLEGISYEGFLGTFAFNGGLDNKNFFAAALIGCFSGIYFFYKFEEKSRFDIFCLFFILMLFVTTNSRSGYILFVIFILLCNYNSILRIKSNQKKYVTIVLLILILPIVIYIYNEYALNSETYMYRINGIINWAIYYADDYFHIIFGAAEMAFRDSGDTYNKNIRSVLGWNGSTELVILNIFLKNGFLGFLGYMLIIIRVFFKIKKMKNKTNIILIKSLTITLLVSALTDAYMVNVHYVFGMFYYFCISGILGMKCIHCKKKE